MSDTILEKIRKLLALSKSDNPHEAANAAAKAQALATRYRIDITLATMEADPEPSKPRVFTFSDHKLFVCGKRMSLWVWQMACGVITANRLKPFAWGGEIWGSGDAEDAEITRYLLGWLIGEVERLERIERGRLGYQMGKGESKSWGNSFRMGCALMIRARIEEAAEATQKKLTATPTQLEYSEALMEGADAVLALDKRGKYSLALVNQAAEFQVALDDYFKKRFPKMKSRSYGGTYSRGDAFQRGREAGKRANLDGGKRGLPG